MGLLVFVRWVGSPIATGVVNHKLAALPDYTGRVGAVKLALWRGACEVDDFVLFERGHENEPPTVRVDRASLRVAPWPLLRGRIGGRAAVDGAEFTIVKRRQVGAEAAAKQVKAETREKKEQIRQWQEVLRDAFPLELARFELKNGRVRFIDRSHQPNVDVALDKLHIVATGLRNRRGAAGEELPARVNLDAVVTGGGQLGIVVAADPVAEQPRFTAKLEVRQLSLPAFNPFLLAYANADVSRGAFDFYLEVNAQGGGYEGYVKPFFKDLDFRTASDKDKNAAQLLAKKVVAAAAAVLKNDDERKVATKAPFSGNFDNNEVDLWTTLANLLRNAFVRGLREGLDGQTPRT